MSTSKSPYYKAIGKEVEVFEHSYKNKIPFLLKGPTGTGKSRFIEFMAHKLDKKLITISCHEETSSTDLITSLTLNCTSSFFESIARIFIT